MTHIMLDGMSDDAGEMQRQRDVLANAIRDAALATGHVAQGAVLEGPHLLLLLEDMRDEILRLREKPSTSRPA